MSIHLWDTRLGAAFVLAAALFGCGRSDPIVVIQLHPNNPDIIYVVTNDYIYKTRDGGQTWTNLSKGMSYSRVIAMAIDPVYPTTVYAGTKGDAVYKSHDGGQRWISMRSGLDDATITSVVNQFLFDPADAQHIFLATTMGVFETKNGGEHWMKKMEGMKEVLMVVTLGMDPTRPSILYAGTSGGVYKSVDQAGRWEKVNNGLVPPDMLKTSRALNVTSILVDLRARYHLCGHARGAVQINGCGQVLEANRRVACRPDDCCHDTGSNASRRDLHHGARWSASQRRWRRDMEADEQRAYDYQRQNHRAKCDGFEGLLCRHERQRFVSQQRCGRDLGADAGAYG
ncbi:MAG: hypothetical protein CV088_15060 [Nitrospira sp. LK70]|nr:hypothetical protein [Nitrospira sp. LK70]